MTSVRQAAEWIFNQALGVKTLPYNRWCVTVLMTIVVIVMGCSDSQESLETQKQSAPMPVLEPVFHYASLDSSKYGKVEVSMITFEEYSKVYDLLRYRGESSITDYEPIPLEEIKELISAPIALPEYLIMDAIFIGETLDITETAFSFAIGNNRETFSLPTELISENIDIELKQMFISTHSDSICRKLHENLRDSLPQRFIIKIKLINRFKGGISVINNPELYACYQDDYYELDELELIGSNTYGRGRYHRPDLDQAEDGSFYYMLPDLFLVDLDNPIFTGITSEKSKPIRFQLRVTFIVEPGVVNFTDHLFASNWKLEKYQGKWVVFNKLAQR